MEQIKTMKVAMVCHLSNPTVRRHLPLDNGARFGFLRKLLGLNQWKEGYTDLAPWNASLADDFGKRGDIEFHIISAHPGMKKQRVTFVDNNVHYVFLNHNIASLLKCFVKNKGLWQTINPFAIRVKNEINKINPDLVVLQGTENAYYSSTVLGITEYPVYAMCQTVYNNPSRKEYGMWNAENGETELRLFKELKYFGVYCKMHFELVRQYSPHSYIFKFGYPQKGILLEPIETYKEFDFINFALSMDSRKGFPDAIQALAIVKKIFPQVRLNLIGKCSDEQLSELKNLISNLDLENNIVFTPFFEKRSDLFLHIQKSRFAVLPCKVDHISGTMMQAMQLGLPLVVYRTTGTPSFNKEKQCALIAENNNVEELAQHMLSLMENPKLAEVLKKNGREWQEKRCEEGLQNGDRIVNNFRTIINHYKYGTPIPKEQLYNPDIDD